MRHTLLTLVAAAAFAWQSWASPAISPVPAPQAALIAAEAPAAAEEAPAEESVPEEASAAEEIPAEAEAQPEGLLDKILAIMKSTEAIIGGLISLLAALGILASVVSKLKKVKGALNTVTHKIEEHQSKHEVATKNLKEDIAKAAPKHTAIGAEIHKAVEIAEVRVKNGG